MQVLTLFMITLFACTSSLAKPQELWISPRLIQALKTCEDDLKEEIHEMNLPGNGNPNETAHFSRIGLISEWIELLEHPSPVHRTFSSKNLKLLRNEWTKALNLHLTSLVYNQSLTQIRDAIAQPASSRSAIVVAIRSLDQTDFPPAQQWTTWTLDHYGKDQHTSWIALNVTQFTHKFQERAAAEFVGAMFHELRHAIEEQLLKRYEAINKHLPASQQHIYFRRYFDIKENQFNEDFYEYYQEALAHAFEIELIAKLTSMSEIQIQKRKLRVLSLLSNLVPKSLLQTAEVPLASPEERYERSARFIFEKKLDARDIFSRAQDMHQEIQTFVTIHE